MYAWSVTTGATATPLEVLVEGTVIRVAVSDEMLEGEMVTLVGKTIEMLELEVPVMVGKMTELLELDVKIDVNMSETETVDVVDEIPELEATMVVKVSDVLKDEAPVKVGDMENEMPVDKLKGLEVAVFVKMGEIVSIILVERP